MTNVDPLASLRVAASGVVNGLALDNNPVVVSVHQHILAAAYLQQRIHDMTDEDLEFSLWHAWLFHIGNSGLDIEGIAAARSSGEAARRMTGYRKLRDIGE